MRVRSFELDVPSGDVIHGDVRASSTSATASADTTVAPDEARELARRTDVGTLLLIEGAGHTFDARHPFHVSTPELDRAIEATRDHFSRHLSD